MAMVTWNTHTRTLFNVLNPGDADDLYGISTANAAVTFDLLAKSSNWQAVVPYAKRSLPVGPK